MGKNEKKITRKRVFKYVLVKAIKETIANDARFMATKNTALLNSINETFVDRVIDRFLLETRGNFKINDLLLYLKDVLVDEDDK